MKDRDQAEGEGRAIMTWVIIYDSRPCAHLATMALGTHVRYVRVSLPFPSGCLLLYSEV